MKQILLIFFIVSSLTLAIEDREYYKNGRVLGDRLFRLKTNKKYIVLTIDDGPSHYTGQILSILDKNKVKATFFLVGSEIESYPAMVKRIKDEGHEIGNHSFTHRDFKSLTNEQILEEELILFDEILTDNNGGKTNLVRPPYGSVTSEQVKFIRNNGYYLINWSLDTFDWKQDLMVSLNIISTKHKNGDIILMHSNKLAPYLLPELIREFKSRGYIFVTLKDFLKNKDLEEFPIEDDREISKKRKEFLKGSIKSDF